MTRRSSMFLVFDLATPTSCFCETSDLDTGLWDACFCASSQHAVVCELMPATDFIPVLRMPFLSPTELETFEASLLRGHHPFRHVVAVRPPENVTAAPYYGGSGLDTVAFQQVCAAYVRRARHGARAPQHWWRPSLTYGLMASVLFPKCLL